jgi:protein O-GlcNAc transferase
MNKDLNKLQEAYRLHQQGQLVDAANICEKLIRRDSKNYDALHLLGIIKTSLGDFAEAKKLLERSLASKNNKIAYVENYASILFMSQDYDRAVQICTAAIEESGNTETLVYALAASLYKQGRLNEAIDQFDLLLSLYPNHLAGNNEKGSVLAELMRYDEALSYVENALRMNPRYPEAFLNKGNVLRELKKFDDSILAYKQALAINPNIHDAYLGLGSVFRALKRYDEALAAYDKALALKPNLAEAWLVRGNVFLDLKHYDEALAAYDKALALKPNLAEAWLGRGNVFLDLKHYDEALAAYDKALALKPDLDEAWLGRGSVFNYLKRHKEAANAYADLLKIDPQRPFTKGMHLHQKMLSCDWKEADSLIAEITEDVISQKLSAEPFGWQGVAKSPQSLQLCAELFSKHNFPAKNKIVTRKPFANHEKIRIGYSSGELRQQATASLIVGLLEFHDNSRFEICGIDNGWDDQSEIRQRINASVHGIIDIRRLSDASAAAAICENEIDILVNLNGYFGEARTGVFAYRPAAIQVNYLGFPGTLGAGFMDYIIADKHVIPEKHREFYTEKVVYLPNSYQANDNKKKISAHNFTRLELGLPEKGFVFCCFNNSYKILPDVFDCWMRILRKIDGSVLWLIEDNAEAATNLGKEAVARGISADRLVFAKRIPISDHLARHKLADLFLDTLPYNAHTTASDALWTGLPVLTCLGETFAGRVAASLLNAIHVPELITTTPEAYEQMAVDLATHPEKLAAIKHKLAENRLTTPLFDTKLFTKHIEAAYSAMYERYHSELPPDHIVIPN